MSADVAESFSVCILHFKAPAHIRRLLAEMTDWTVQPDAVYVVDNSGEFAVPEARITAQGFPVRWLISTSNVGYGAGINAGITEARQDGHERLLILTQDTSLARCAAQALTKRLSAETSAAIAAPVLAYSSDQNTVFSAGGSLSDRGEAPHLLNGTTTASLPATGSQKVDWADGACLMLRLPYSAAVDDFPEEYFLYVEEIDFALSLSLSGYSTVIDFAARAAQEPGRLTAYLLFRNSMWLTIKYNNRFKRWPWLLRILSIQRASMHEGRLRRTVWALRGVRDAHWSRMGKPPRHLFAA